MIRRIVIDANIAFRVLARSQGDLRRLVIRNGPLGFYTPKFLIVELFKHKERLAKAMGESDEKLLEYLNTFIGCVHFVDESAIPIGTWLEGYRLCRDVDRKDTPYVALSLYLEAPIWTLDVELTEGLRARGFNSFVSL